MVSDDQVQFISAKITKPLKFSLFAMSEHETHYFHPHAEGKKKCPDPDIFGCQKHQYTAQNEQCDGQESFGARVSDHGDNVLHNLTMSPRHRHDRFAGALNVHVLTIVDGNDMSRII